MEIGKRVPRKRLRLTRSLVLEPRNVLRLRASLDWRLGTLHRIFNRFTSTPERTQKRSIAGHKFPRSMEPDLLRSIHGGSGCAGTRAILKSGGGRKFLRSQLRNYFEKHPVRTLGTETFTHESREAKPFTRKKDWSRLSFGIEMKLP